MAAAASAEIRDKVASLSGDENEIRPFFPYLGQA
jgi:hypothetical protein